MYDDGHLRRYLLGELNDDEQRLIEEALLKDDELFHSLLAVEDELVDDYVSGALSVEERKGFEGFFLSTSERQRKLGFAMALRRYITAEAGAVTTQAESAASSRVIARPSPVIGHLSLWWKQAFSSPYMRMTAATVILLGLALGIWRVFFYQSEVSKGMAALAKAYRTERPVEARISGLGYAPLNTTRGAEQPKVDDVSLNRAERILLDEVTEHPTAAAAHHALGRFYLAERKFDQAITQFDEALKSDPNNAQLHSDYGAALLEMGKAEGEGGKRFELIARASEQFNNALRLDSSLLEALFNQALCHVEMKLEDQAEEEWRQYLERDPNSTWADEARQRLQQLEEKKGKSSRHPEQFFERFMSAYAAKDDAEAWQALRRGRARTGNGITERLLDLYLEGAPQGHDYIQVVSYAGELEETKSQDRFTKDLARFYQTASPGLLGALVEARRVMRKARKAYDEDEYEETAKLYARAANSFAQMGDSCEAAIAECWTGIASLRIDARKGLRILEPLSDILNKKDYRYLLVQTLSGVADSKLSLRESSEALGLGVRIFDLSQQIEDPNGMLRSLQLPVAIYQSFGDYRRSLNYVFRAFELAKRFSFEPYEEWPFYQQTAFNFYSMELFEAALDYQQRAVRLALASALPVLRSRSFARLGLIYEKLDSSDEAVRNGELALSEAASFKNKKSRENVIGNSALHLAHLYRQRGELGRALLYYDQAIQIHSGLNIESYQFEAHKGKLLALIGLNDNAAAEAEVRAAVEMIEQYRPRISEESNRNSFFDLAQSIYDIAIGFSYSRMHDIETAFRYAESSHARSLLDLTRTNAKVIRVEERPELKLEESTVPLAVNDIKRLLPESTQILEFSVLNDKILIWVISRDEIRCTESMISVNVLSEDVRRYRALIATHNDSDYQEAVSISEKLYDSLITKVEPLLIAKYLCIVPDNVLVYLPFGALISPNTGRYFVEDHCFVLAPSANIFLTCSERASKSKGVKVEKFLGIGNPSFDRNLFPNLQAAEKEVQEISGLYDASLTLCGDKARESRIKREMKSAEVIQFSTHYVVDEKSPLLSKLLLAREPQLAETQSEDGFLDASEIYDMRLARTRLVVLSACQTGIERSYQGEGAISIARPFLKAGVPLVIASLWPVDSDSTSELMVSFHKHRKQDEALSTAEALRRAEREMLAGATVRYRHPYYWAAFATIGGYARF